MRTLILSTLTLLLMTQAQAQTVLPLWPAGQIPNDLKNTTIQEKSEAGKDGITRVSDITNPTLTVYEPPKGKANGTAVMVCPGGGYAIEAMSHEGTEIAEWLNGMGITAFVLKYRLPDDRLWANKYEVPLQDAKRGMVLIRENAAKYGLNTQKIGVIGFSAGGHLASTLSTHWHKAQPSDPNCKPDFAILMYPVISSGEYAHAGSFERLLGKNPSAEMKELYSNDKQVSDKTPPTLLIHAINDKGVPVENSFLYASALKKADVATSLYVYESGGHGFGLAKKQNGTVKNWPADCQRWLVAMGWL